MLMTVLAGQPVMDTSNLALVLVNVTMAVPLQVDSASVIGGFSFDAFRSALKTLAAVGAGLGVGLGVGAAAGLPQPAARLAAAALPAKRRVSILPVRSAGLRPAARLGRVPKPRRSTGR